MFCPRCGRDNPPMGKFCNECGFPLHDIDALIRNRDAASASGTGSPHAPEPPLPGGKEDLRQNTIRTTSPLPDTPAGTSLAGSVDYPHVILPAKEGVLSGSAPLASAGNQRAAQTPMPAQIRNPSLAVLLSFIPGLGQVYNGNLGRGIILFLVTVAGLIISIVPGVCVWIYSIYDSYATAVRINRGEISFGR